MKKENTPRKRVVFELASQPGRRVYVAGTFNEWAPAKHELVDKGGDGTYRKQVLVPRGRHEYKFVIDDSWCIDPACDEWTTNTCGTLNSILVAE